MAKDAADGIAVAVQNGDVGVVATNAAKLSRMSGSIQRDRSRDRG
ncbi:MAG: hypothetical protein ACI92S_000687 [Planctomycetaceae bacterium]|jgi:hypothetical protein